jgi:hypothetical protein
VLVLLLYALRLTAVVCCIDYIDNHVKQCGSICEYTSVVIRSTSESCLLNVRYNSVIEYTQHSGQRACSEYAIAYCMLTAAVLALLLRIVVSAHSNPKLVYTSHTQCVTMLTCVCESTEQM